jgi:hypothetical protein
LFTGRDIKNNKITVYDATLADTGAETLCVWAVYDVINNHLLNRDEVLSGHLNQLNILIKEKELINRLSERMGLSDEIKERGSTVDINIGVVRRRFPPMKELVTREMSCDFMYLYEINK